MQNLTAYQAAEVLQTAFCKSDFPNVSYVLGSDWGSGRCFKDAAAYMRAAYELADSKFGTLPFRYELEA